MITDIVREVTVSSYRHVDNKRTDNTYGNYNHYGAKFILLVHRPSKHAGSDSEAFWLWSVKAITAGVQPGSGRSVSAESDLPRPIRFHILSKKAWPAFRQKRQVRKQTGVQESSGPVRDERNLPATSFSF